MSMKNSPVHEHEGQWYFWDETWADRVGPFDTREDASDALADYCEQLDYQSDEKNVTVMTESQLFERSFYRPKNFFMLSAPLQWAIDKKLGLLDWNVKNLTDEEKARFDAYYQKEDLARCVSLRVMSKLSGVNGKGTYEIESSSEMLEKVEAAIREAILAYYQKEEPRSQYTEIGTPAMRVIEECGELIQAVMKGERFGYDAHHPNRPETNNLVDVRHELQDIVDAVYRLEAFVHKGPSFGLPTETTPWNDGE